MAASTCSMLSFLYVHILMKYYILKKPSFKVKHQRKAANSQIGVEKLYKCNIKDSITFPALVNKQTKGKPVKICVLKSHMPPRLALSRLTMVCQLERS